MHVHKYVTLIFAMSLTSCITPQSTEHAAQNESTEQLAADYFATNPETCIGNFYCDSIRTNLIARNVIPNADWPNINQHIVTVGMGALSVIAAWGEPTDVNTTTTSTGEIDQWVYRPCPGCKASYAYLQDGRVTAIQN